MTTTDPQPDDNAEPGRTTEEAAADRASWAQACARVGRGDTPLLVRLGESSVELVIPDAAGDGQIRRLPFGIGTLATDTVRHVPPTPLELETAIEVVEPAIMALGLHLPATTVLVLDDAGLLHSRLPPDARHRDDVERLFQRVAAVALGRPAVREGLPADGRFVAAVLVLRELLHHLGVERVVPLAPHQADASQGRANTVTAAGPEPLKNAET